MASNTTTKPRVALVTGCSPGGIGFYLAKELNKRGYRVFATTRKGTTIEGLEDCDILNLDVTDPASVGAAAEKVKSTAGSLDILVNNAGHGGGRMPLLDVDIEASKAVYESNVWGLLRTTQAFVPLMLQDGPPTPGTKCVVNVGSIAGFRCMPFIGMYGSSKHAVTGLTDCLRLELQNFGIPVTLVAPGFVATKFTENSLLHQQDLPPNSFYRDCWDRILSIKMSDSKTDVEVFCKGTVDAIMSKSPPAHYFAGDSATIVNYLCMIPAWISDKIFRPRTGADLVAYPH